MEDYCWEAEIAYMRSMERDYWGQRTQEAAGSPPSLSACSESQHLSKQIKFFIILKEFETTCRINNQKTTESAIIKMNQQAQTNLHKINRPGRWHTCH